MDDSLDTLLGGAGCCIVIALLIIIIIVFVSRITNISTNIIAGTMVAMIAGYMTGIVVEQSKNNKETKEDEEEAETFYVSKPKLSKITEGERLASATNSLVMEKNDHDYYAAAKNVHRGELAKQSDTNAHRRLQGFENIFGDELASQEKRIWWEEQPVTSDKQLLQNSQTVYDGEEDESMASMMCKNRKQKINYSQEPGRKNGGHNMFAEMSTMGAAADDWEPGNDFEQYG